jgi:glucosamine--fructose-6-phosphate aminotransferase (isomerizing)
VSGYSVAEIRRQTEALSSDLPGLLERATEGACRAMAGAPAADRIVALGSGDSLNAAIASRSAFAAGHPVEYWPLTPSEFLDHPPPGQAPGSGTIVVAISASGGNPALLAATKRAREAGCRTIAVTAHLESALAETAEHIVPVRTAGAIAPSPGIRTYQGSLVGLLALARELADGAPAAFGGVHGGLAAGVARSAEIAAVPLATLSAAPCAGIHVRTAHPAGCRPTSVTSRGWCQARTAAGFP